MKLKLVSRSGAQRIHVRQVVLKKLNKMKWILIDDDMFYNDTAVDAKYPEGLPGQRLLRVTIEQNK
ncbi:hypothetical protein COOONC_15735 [Cooperia oncophora]